MIDGKLEVPVTLRITQGDLNGINQLAHKLRLTFPQLIQEWIDRDIDRHVVAHDVAHTEPGEAPKIITPADEDY